MVAYLDIGRNVTKYCVLLVFGITESVGDSSELYRVPQSAESLEHTVLSKE